MRISPVLLALVGLIASVPSDAQPLFSISAPTFSVSVSGNREPVGIFFGGRVFRSQLRHGRLYFSFRIIGAQAAIDYLTQNGELAVRVTTWGPLGRLNDYEIGITQDDWEKHGQVLSDEQLQDGIFRWRTKLWVGRLEHPTITITIEDINGSRVSQQGDEGRPYEGVAQIRP